MLVINSDKNKFTLNLLRTNLDTVREVESFFQNVYYREVTTRKIMRSEMHEQLNQKIPVYVEVQKKFATIDIGKLKKDVRDDAQAVQNILDQHADSFQKSLELYNAAYAAYISDDMQSLEPYLSSEDEKVQTIVERFKEYIDQKNFLRERADNSNCILDSGTPGEICSDLKRRYDETVLSMQDSFSVPQGIFFAYADDFNYKEEKLLAPIIERVIKELER